MQDFRDCLHILLPDPIMATIVLNCTFPECKFQTQPLLAADATSQATALELFTMHRADEHRRRRRPRRSVPI